MTISAIDSMKVDSMKTGGWFDTQSDLLSPLTLFILSSQYTRWNLAA